MVNQSGAAVLQLKACAFRLFPRNDFFVLLKTDN
jgi:hypothetical protein